MSEKFIVTQAASATANGTVPVYVETEDGRKAAAVWGKGDERYARAYLFAAAPELLAALKIARGYVVNTIHLKADIKAIDRAIFAAEDVT